MPCREPSPSFRDLAEAADKAERLAELLCEACQIIHANNLQYAMSDDLAMWSWSHRKYDKTQGRPWKGDEGT